eukprot:5696075-Karenia_brevis.AAC.1
MPIFIGMKVFITRNLNKDIDFINGMACVVDGYDSVNDGLRLITETGKRLTSYYWTDTNLGYISYHPIRPGYCSTILKYQGAELAHVTLYLDKLGVPGAAYTALSRVSAASDYLIGGNGVLKPDHFCPAHENLQRRVGLRAFAGRMTFSKACHKALRARQRRG